MDIYGSNSDSSLFTESSGSESEEIGMGGPSNAANPFFDDSRSDEEVKRVARSVKDKRNEDLDKSVKKIRNSMKINDWNAISEEWFLLLKLIEKSKVFMTTLPSYYVSLMVALEDLINKTFANKELRKGMRAKNAKSLTAMKQQFHKYLEKNELGLVERMKKYKESRKKIGSGSTESSEDPDDEPTTPTGVNIVTLINDTESDDKIVWTQDKIDRRVKEMLSKRGTKNYDKKEHLLYFKFFRSKCSGLNNKLTLDFHVVNSLFDMSHSANPMNGLLWKRVYNFLVSIIDDLFTHADLVLYESKEDLFAAVGDDSTEKLSDEKRKNVVVGHLLFSLERLGDEYYHSLQNIEAPSEQYFNRLSYENPYLRLLQYAYKYYHLKSDTKRATVVAQRLLSFLYYRKEVDPELKKLYIQRGLDAAAKQAPKPVPEVIDPCVFKSHQFKAQKKKTDDESGESGDEASDQDEEALVEAGETEEDLYPPAAISDDFDLLTLVPKLVAQVCQHSPEDRSKRKAILQHIYHLALHDKFYDARDCLLMTHLQEKINKASFNLQVLFNRAMVQLGLSAFRIGRIKDAHNCLQEIVSAGKTKELLAQGMNPRYQTEKTKEQEKQEYRRQIPFHMHINLELLECVHSVVAMLLEVPNMAQSRYKDNKRKVVSKFFQKVISYYDRQIFTGPPENSRESIIIASKALEFGDWKKCRDDVLALPVWSLIPNNAGVKSMVAQEIQEQGLRTYLFSFGQFYDSLSQDELSGMFELAKNDVHSIISKMIITEELNASWDQPTGALMIHGQDPTALQALSLSYAEKISVLSETSENTDPRNFNDRRGAWGPPGLTKGKDSTSYGNPYGPSVANYAGSNFNYNYRQIGTEGRSQPRPIGRVGPSQVRGGAATTPAAVAVAAGGFVQRDKKGKARPVADGGFRQRK